MKKNVLLFILGVVALFAQPLFADHHEDQGNKKPVMRKNTLYIEGLGPAPFVSVNYDRKVGDFSIRVGAGWAKITDFVLFSYNMISAPIVVNYLGLGNNTHMFEVGGGFSLFYVHMEASSTLTFIPFIPKRQMTLGSHFGLAGVVVIGYRFQADMLNFRVGGDLSILKTDVLMTPHLSVGVSF